jgi:ribosomal protein L2
MRSDPAIPKAGIQRLRDKDGVERYWLIEWDVHPTKRVLMGVYDSLEKANEMVLYDVPRGEQRLPPNMHLNHR